MVAIESFYGSKLIAAGLKLNVLIDHLYNDWPSNPCTQFGRSYLLVYLLHKMNSIICPKLK